MLSDLCTEYFEGSKSITCIRRDSKSAAWKDKVSKAVHYSVYRMAPDECKEDYDIALTAVHRCGSVYPHLPEAFQSDRRIVMAAVGSDASIFEDLPENLRADLDIARAAVKGDGAVLKFAPPEVQANLSIVRDAVKSNYWALLHSCPDCWDSELVLSTLAAWALDKKPSVSKELLRHPRMQQLFGEKNFVMAALRRDPDWIKFASSDLRSDREVVGFAVSAKGSALQWVSDEMRADPEIVALAVGKDPLALKFASELLRADRDLVLMAVKSDARALCHASLDLQRTDSEIVVTALRNRRMA